MPASSAKVNLQGWGVDLAIKNVEYKAMDDSKVAKGSLSSLHFFHTFLTFYFLSNRGWRGRGRGIGGR